MIAEVADDLEQALLRGGGVQAGTTCRRSTEKSLACEAQHGIIFGGGPFVVASLHFEFEFCVIALHSANPKPRQDDVHGEIGDALFSEQRLGLAHSRRAKCPVPEPKVITPDRQNLCERIE